MGEAHALVGDRSGIDAVGLFQRWSDAEKRYEIVSRGDDEDAKCSAARDVAEGYLKDENEQKYRDWKLRADVYCQTAALHG